MLPQLRIEEKTEVDLFFARQLYNRLVIPDRDATVAM